MNQEVTITKKCAACKIEKPISDFSRDNYTTNGRYYQCKPCSVLKNKASKQKKKEGVIIAF